MRAKQKLFEIELTAAEPAQRSVEGGAIHSGLPFRRIYAVEAIQQRPVHGKIRVGIDPRGKRQAFVDGLAVEIIILGADLRIVSPLDPFAEGAAAVKAAVSDLGQEGHDVFLAPDRQINPQRDVRDLVYEGAPVDAIADRIGVILHCPIRHFLKRAVTPGPVKVPNQAAAFQIAAHLQEFLPPKADAPDAAGKILQNRVTALRRFPRDGIGIAQNGLHIRLAFEALQHFVHILNKIRRKGQVVKDAYTAVIFCEADIEQIAKVSDRAVVFFAQDHLNAAEFRKAGLLEIAADLFIALPMGGFFRVVQGDHQVGTVRPGVAPKAVDTPYQRLISHRVGRRIGA